MTAVQTDTFSPPPTRSAEQRAAALRKANDVRRFRAKLKRDLKAGTQHWGPVLSNPQRAGWATMPVRTLLEALPAIGRKKAHQIMVAGQIAYSKRLGGLSERQRLWLVVYLEGRGL